MTEKKNIGVLISGGGTNLQAIIDAVESGYIEQAEVKVVISNQKSAFGLQRAKKHGIPTVFISKKQAGSNESFNERLIAELQKYDIDLVVLAGFMSILLPSFIQAFRSRIINIHPALIPSFCGKGYYGERVHQAAIDYGVKLSGATVHFVDEGTDTGPIILQTAVEVKPDDTAETLQKRILKEEHKLLPKAVKLFCLDKLKLIKREKKRPLVKII